jgi:hypothetical protein
MIETLFALAFAVTIVIGAMMLADTLALGLQFRRNVVTSLLAIVAFAAVLFGVLFGSLLPLQYVGRALSLTVAGICFYFGYEVGEHDYLSVPAMAVPAYALLELIYYAV